MMDVTAPRSVGCRESPSHASLLTSTGTTRGSPRGPVKMQPMTKRLLLLVATACLAALPRAHAVSDGNYNNTTQGCTRNAYNSDSPDSTEPHCYSATGQISDGTHNYVTVGIPMTADGQSPSSLELCIDLGTGTRQCALLDQSGVTPEPPTAGTPANPASGLRFYFGANDNLDDGEHDSSEQVDNGPSDSKTDCGGHSMSWWDKQQGTVYAEPGIQIYEDPDPQGSPIGPYPLPAFYVGTCGLVIGGGQVQMPASPYTSPAGQFVVTT